ncbi:MAG TPA: hypothetical protein VHY20_16020 [Pirellulales bacterium]|jgi:hypothetical protein|nr:hypothetical protein [Pirellulales bacterium]
MSTTLESDIQGMSTTTAARRLRSSMAAVRVSFTWFGARKALSNEQRAEAAESFGAAGDFLSAAKKLLDTTDPAFKAVTAVRGRALSFWKGMSLPYPEPAIRLVRQEGIPTFDQQMHHLQQELDEAVENLDRHYDQLRGAARQRLGRLFNSADYPSSLNGLFRIEHDYPSVEPPSYLRQLSPELFEQEHARVSARFEEAVRLAEAAFTSEFGKLVSHLVERLSGQEDGKPKVFRDSAVANLADFFARFRALNVRSNHELDQLVEQAQQLVRGVPAQTLRDNTALRQHLATQLAEVEGALGHLIVERPRRNVLRRVK